MAETDAGLREDHKVALADLAAAREERDQYRRLETIRERLHSKAMACGQCDATGRLLDEVERLRATVARVGALADELRHPDVSLYTPVERATRRTVSRELRAALEDPR